MKVIIKFTKDSPYYKNGEKERIVKNLTEIHYSYPSVLNEKQTAFESGLNTDGFGFTIFNKWIEEFEVLN